MARKNNNVSERLRKVLDYLEDPSHPEGISQNDFQKLIGLKSRTSFYNYLSSASEAGYIFSSITINRKTYYSLVSKPEGHKYSELSVHDYYSFLILREILTHPEGMYLDVEKSGYRIQNTDFYERDSLFDRFCFGNDEDDYSYEKINVDIGRNQMRNIINKMADDGIVKKVWSGRAGYAYYPAQGSEQLLFRCSKEKLDNILFYISQISPYRRDYPSLESAYNKMCISIGKPDELKPSGQNFIFTGRKYKSYSEIRSLLDRLSGVDYIDYLLELIYYEDNILIKCFFATGLIVFSEEDNKLYLLGRQKEYPNAAGKYTFLDIEAISGIDQSPYQNREYKSNIYIDHYKKMFVIGMSEYEKVSISFKDIFNIGKKLKQLQDLRSETSHCNQNSQSLTLEYHDVTCDYKRMLPLLCSIGRAATVHAPSELIAQVRDELENNLIAYREAGFDV